jgi:hypothetical protein
MSGTASVEFSELAGVALDKLFGDRRAGAEAALRWYLPRKGVQLSIPAAAFPGRTFYLYAFHADVRVLWEASSPIRVCAVFRSIPFEAPQ